MLSKVLLRSFKAIAAWRGHMDLDTSCHRKFVLHDLNEGSHRLPPFHIPLAPGCSPQTLTRTQTDAEINTELS